MGFNFRVKRRFGRCCVGEAGGRGGEEALGREGGLDFTSALRAEGVERISLRYEKGHWSWILGLVDVLCTPLTGDF